MSSENTPSVTISYTHGSWQWDDGTAACHGHESAAEAAADWQRDSAWRAARATAGSPAGRTTEGPGMREWCAAAVAARTWKDVACAAMAAHGRPCAIPSGDDDWASAPAGPAPRYRRDPWL